MATSQKNPNPTNPEVLKEIIEDACSKAYVLGYREGYHDGVQDTRESHKKAISDGLRRGSPECGAAMQGLK